MWSLGVICYMLLSGGISPFFHKNCVKLEANIMAGVVDLAHASLQEVTQEAKNFTKSLLVVEQTERLSAQDCLQHK